MLRSGAGGSSNAKKKMDKKPYVSQSQLLNESNEIACGITHDDGADDLPSNINQMEFQTMKAASDTAKVCVRFNWT